MKITKHTFTMAGTILLPMAVGLASSSFTSMSVQTWYLVLEKPALNPPGWIFGPVWTILYLLMGYALWRIMQVKMTKKNEVDKRLAVLLFSTQLFLNFFWSIIFFGLWSPGGALIEIMLMWLFIAATLLAFLKLDRRAGYLLVPYILWVSFATYLNYSIWFLN
ncbi:tryptophan-rich sensory protein [Patescibacteria group bacterium]|nr:tryptophan-rich sensory protein [Patescibacteria group bacterium]